MWFEILFTHFEMCEMAVPTVALKQNAQLTPAEHKKLLIQTFNFGGDWPHVEIIFLTGNLIYSSLNILSQFQGNKYYN